MRDWNGMRPDCAAVGPAVPAADRRGQWPARHSRPYGEGGSYVSGQGTMIAAFRSSLGVSTTVLRGLRNAKAYTRNVLSGPSFQSQGAASARRRSAMR